MIKGVYKIAPFLSTHSQLGVTFGATTPSYDLEKEIDRFFPHEHISAETVSEALPGFLGEQDQVAPLFSAKSVDGVRAYELARKLYKANSGSDSELDSAAEQLLRVSRIHITELELMEFIMESVASEDPRLSDDRHPLAVGVVNDQQTAQRAFAASSHEVGGVALHTAATSASSRINVTDNSALGLPRAVIRMACSKGTYVRAFARDLGETLGSGAHLDSLQRSRSGIFRVENALTIDQALQKLQGVFRN